jgi:hypothetical protein
MDEKMYPIKGLEGFYSITKSGRVFSLPRNPKRNKNCYLTNEISISQNKDYKYFKAWIHPINKHISLHRALAMTFIPNPENKPMVNHIDGDKLNNDLSNLEWVTAKENAIHAWENGLYGTPPTYWKGKIGKEHCNSKPIIQYDKDMNLINEFDSTACAVRATGFNRGSLKCCLNYNKKLTKPNRTSHGFIWVFKNQIK